jgi:predicted RNA-binding Zn ribbon-like protein
MSSNEERPAPDGLELIRGFVNTRDIEQGTDELATPADLRAWARRNGLAGAGAPVGASELAAALAVREAFRALLVANAAGEDPPDDAIELLNESARRHALAPRLDVHGRSTIVSEGDPIGALLTVMYEELATGRWTRLKACLEGSCHWAFYDTSRNSSSHWCQMGVCGNRSKNRAYYARQRARDDGSNSAAS